LVELTATEEDNAPSALADPDAVVAVVPNADQKAEPSPSPEPVAAEVEKEEEALPEPPVSQDANQPEPVAEVPNRIVVPEPEPEPVAPTGHTTFFPAIGEAEIPAPVAATGQQAPVYTTTYDHLFDDPTRLSLAEVAAVRDIGEEASPENGDGNGADDDDDHDGFTIASFTPLSDPGTATAPADASASHQPTALARICSACNRPNSTRRAACSACGAALQADPVAIARPVLGEILLSTGERIPLDRPVIIGRKPNAPRFSNADMPRLVVVESPRQDISRSHLKIDLEDWSVIVSDLGSTNGTVLRREGQPDRRLKGPEQMVAQVGDVYDLGDGITVQVVSLA
jgi:hypothetical protein